MEIIKKALDEGRSTLSEHESKLILGAYGIPVTREIVAYDEKEYAKALDEIGFPMVVKGNSPDMTHKTEAGLIRVDVRNRDEADSAFQDITSRMEDKGKAILVQEMIKGSRELMIGMNRDAQFGPCVMFGLGGIFTEVLRDVTFRVAPLEKRDALEMMQEIRAHSILSEIRGLPAADLDQISEILIKVGQIGLENDEIKEIDINPLILSGSSPVAVDALVVLSAPVD